MNPRLNIVHDFVGSTLRTTLVNSGATITPISSALINGSETLISSKAMTSSGNGFFYADLSLPNTPQWLVNEFIAVINANTYKKYQLINVVKPEVDL